MIILIYKKLKITYISISAYMKCVLKQILEAVSMKSSYHAPKLVSIVVTLADE